MKLFAMVVIENTTLIGLKLLFNG